MAIALLPAGKNPKARIRPNITCVLMEPNSIYIHGICAFSFYFWTTTPRILYLRGDVKFTTYKPHTNHKKPSVSSHTLAPTTICDLSHSLCWSPLTDLGHISSATHVCHPLWFVCGHRKGFLTCPLTSIGVALRATGGRRGAPAAARGGTGLGT